MILGRGFRFSKFRDSFISISTLVSSVIRGAHSEHAPASNTGHSVFPSGSRAHFSGRGEGSPETGQVVAWKPKYSKFYSTTIRVQP